MVLSQHFADNFIILMLFKDISYILFCNVFRVFFNDYVAVANIIQLLDEAEQNIVIYQWRADQLFADAERVFCRFS